MSDNTPTILFLDSEKSAVSNILSSLEITFSNTFRHISSTNDLSRHLRNHDAHVLIVDVTFENNVTGLKILEKLKNNASTILIAAVPSDDQYLISKVIEKNPFFYINKPYNTTEVSVAIKRALEKLQHSLDQQRAEKLKSDYCGIVGKSSIMTHLFDLITRVAEDDFSTVLIRGESGTGKELVAKAIHNRSRRNNNNFVPVNCAAIPDDLLESELFGHVKGAFTGATHNKQGRIQFADGGTLFLDEIGDMKPTLQAKLLRVLQEKEFEPVGGLQPTPVDTRILAATHCDLEQLVKEGTFREDLYYRLSVIPLSIPPLSSRKEDIPLLIDTFIESYTVERGRQPFQFSQDALENLLRYNWRGNVRELENLVQHMSILFSGKIVDSDELPEKFTIDENLSDDDVSHILQGSTVPLRNAEVEGLPALTGDFIFSDKGVDFNEMVNEFEKELIISALRVTAGNKKEAAKLLKLKRTTLLEKIKKKKLSPDNW